MARQAQKTETKTAAIPEPADAQRLDKWLWFARVAKTRTLAAGLVSDGRVRVNRIRVIKPAHVVRAGDVVTVSVGRGVRVLKILAGGVRRGPASEAAALYDEIVPLQSASRPPQAGDAAQPGPAAATGTGADAGAGQGGPVNDAGSGRPTKKDRRTLDRLRGIGEPS